MNKKKLLYMYIDEFRGFQKREFNFSTDMNFHLDEVDNNLVLKQDKSVMTLPEGFWGSYISEVNILLGSNGSGKTRVIKTICQWMCQLSEGNYPQEKGVLIFQEKDNLYYAAFYQEHSLDISISIPEMKLLSTDSLKSYCSDLKLVYFSNTMTGLDSEQCDILSDYSMPHRIEESNEFGFSMDGDIIAKYRQYEFNKQYAFLGQYNSGENDLGKNDTGAIPKYIQIEIHSLSFDRIGSLLPEKHKKIFEDLSEIWENHFGRYTRDNVSERTLYIEIFKSLFIGVLCKMIKWEYKYVVDGKKIVINVLKGLKWGVNDNLDIKTSSEWIIQLLKDLFKDCREKLSDSNKQNFEKYWGEENGKIEKNIFAFIDMIVVQFESNKTTFFSISDLVHESLDKEVKIWQISTAIKEMGVFQEFWEVYEKIAFCMENVFFYWNASSGQQNWMNLFSLLCDNSLDNKNVWFFLDEPNNTFHPEWERNLLNWIIKSCERNQKDKDIQKGKNIQIFIATHSPIMLSDVPGASVSYLSREDNSLHPNTFGQNLYVLFNDALCLKKGVMGAFASNKILDVLKEMKDLEQNMHDGNTVNSSYQIEACEKVIDLVAEPLFKNQMQEYLTRCKRLIEGW